MGVDGERRTPMRKPVARKTAAAGENQFTDLTLDQAREMLALTDAIVANLNIINSPDSIFDLDDLEVMDHQANNVVAGLRVINENDVPDLETMETQVSSIVTGLRTINEDKNDLADLENQVNSIVDGLATNRQGGGEGRGELMIDERNPELTAAVRAVLRKEFTTLAAQQLQEYKTSIARVAISENRLNKDHTQMLVKLATMAVNGARDRLLAALGKDAENTA
jgi:hypothetical protein